MVPPWWSTAVIGDAPGNVPKRQGHPFGIRMGFVTRSGWTARTSVVVTDRPCQCADVAAVMPQLAAPTWSDRSVLNPPSMASTCWR